MRYAALPAGLVAGLVAGILTGCSGQPEGVDQALLEPSRASAPPVIPDQPTPQSVREAIPAPVVEAPVQTVGPRSTDGRPQRAELSVPGLGLRALVVLDYQGSPDDAPGTAIQDGGELASPHGSGGLVGPGGIGNYLITGHRTSSNRPFSDLPALPLGSRVVVRTRTQRLVYEIVRDQRTSFRSPASLRAQSAAVPGRPGRVANRAMITLSTCATAEDHAVGNYWSDEFHNPEHRLEKVGVLRTITARA